MDKPLQLIQKSSLVFRRGQKELYELICQKLTVNQPITYEEARKIYFAHGCNLMMDGWPHSGHLVKVDGDDWKVKYFPLTEDEVKYATFNWLTNNIGRLVVKGALKVIPMIQLEV